MHKMPTNLKQVAVLGTAAVGIYLFCPPPSGLDSAAWATLVLFAATIVGVLWNPYPIGVMVILALSIGLVTQTLSLNQALKGFSNQVAWTIVSAFLFARAFIKTGLGRRIALEVIQRLGRSSLRLGYSLAISDLILSPVTASNTARTGGIIFPVARSLASEFHSEPGPTARRIGSYVLFTAYQANVVTSALFLTAMAANGLSVRIAQDAAGVQISWATWFKAASLPGFASLLAVPYLIYLLYPPELKKTPQAQVYAEAELKALGPPSRPEKTLAVIFVVLACTWATSGFHGIGTISAALSAVALLLLLGVLDWEDVMGERSAWGTLVWFGGFASMAEALSDSNLVDWFIALSRSWFGGWPPLLALLLLLVVYVYLHYAFASMTSQIIALFGAFLSIAVAAGAPALLAALLFCFFSNLYACLTHYGDGAAPIYFGSGYIDQRDWWRVGFVLSLLHLTTWLGVGLPWWRYLGVW